MIARQSIIQSDSPPSPDPINSNPSAWWSALAIAFVLLVGLDGVMAVLIWLPFYCGLFGFLVAGLIAGGVSFRVARRARPLSWKRVLAGVFLLAVLSTFVMVGWEFWYISSTIGDPPKFARLRNTAMRKGESPDGIGEAAARRFRERLAADHPPGGALGYARWAMGTGKMRLELDGASETVSIGHQGFAWPARTVIACLLTALGLWLSFESLRSSKAVTNVLAAGEAYEEID